MKYQIEKGIPVPRPNTRSTKYPFRDMAVGDSFVVPEKKAANAGAYAHSWGSKNGMKFATRMESDGLRIWRIA